MLKDNEITIGMKVKIIDSHYLYKDLIGKICIIDDIQDFDELGIGYKLDIHQKDYTFSSCDFEKVE